MGCDEELIYEVTIEDRESLLYSQNTVKQKIVYLRATVNVE